MGRLMRVDASQATAQVNCVCGWYAVTYPAAVRAVMDRHRAMCHPRQATYVASKRRARGTLEPVGAGDR